MRVLKPGRARAPSWGTSWKTSPDGLASLARIGRRLPTAEVIVLVAIEDHPDGPRAYLRSSAGLRLSDVLWHLEQARRFVLDGER